MNCSQLSDDLVYTLGIINNPSCLVGHVREDIFEHIGFGKNVSNILHGNSEIDKASNIKATLAVHDYLSSSGRFD